MKIVSKTREEYEDYKKRLCGEKYYIESVIKEIDNPDARRIKFKDERKLTVGLSKKDIMICRGKKKNAFYNCFAMILRFYQDEEFKEIHVKVFNTGKLELPGIQKDCDLIHILNLLIKILKPYQKFESELKFLKDKTETVLINSNFSCGYYINREKLYNILKFDYKINSNYDPCSYPGIQCSYYYLEDREIQNGQQPNYDMKIHNNHVKISFMIFRTGSILIVGKCTEKILYTAYEFIKNVLAEQFDNIFVSINNKIKNKSKKTKPKKKIIYVKKN